MVDQAVIHRKAMSSEVEVRREAVEQLRDNFAGLPDKTQAWVDLIRLTGNEDIDVRWGAAAALGFAFPNIPNKDKAWKDLHRMTTDEDSFMRRGAAVALGIAFRHVPDKDEAWEDLHQLTGDEDSDVRSRAAGALGSAFQYVSDKDAAWEDLHQLIGNEDSDVRKGAASAFRSAFQHVPDKDAAWKDLHRLTVDEDRFVRRGAADALGSAFPYVPDKDAAWKDLIRLIGDGDSTVRSRAADVLGSAFPYVPDKDAAWKDLHRLTGDEDGFVRSHAADALGSAFRHVPDKDAAWKDLHRLIWDKDEDGLVRLHAADALGIASPHIPDKDAAWKDLHRLTGDKDGRVQLRAADALGIAFPHIPDKDAAWEDLIRLTGDESSYVRAPANHSLGRVSIFRATGAENEKGFRKEMKNALEFFERSSKETPYSNPSKFCLPFYRSFYAVTFEKEGAEDEVRRYLAEAKSASEGSENKETLLEAVENLASALTEARKATDFDTMKSDLNAYRRYCDRAADLIGDAEGGAPGAARVLRRGLPIIGERIREIQEKAEALCRETRGTSTPYEPLGLEVNKWARDLSDRGYLRDEKDVPRIRNLLGKLCNLISEDERDYPCKIVEEIREEREPEDNLSDVVTVLSYLVPSIKSQLQNAAKPMTDEMRSDEQPSRKTGHSTTVIAESGSKVVVTQTETESGDVTVTHDAKAIEELQPEEHRIDHRKKTAIEIIAAFAVSVLVAIISPRYLEDLTPTSSTVIAFIAFLILLTIILTQNRDKSS